MLSEPVVVTAPTALPVSVETVRTYLRIDGGDLDDEIQRQLRAAIAAIEKTSGNRLASQIVDVLGDSFADFQRFDVAPVTAIVDVRYLDPAGTAVTLPADSYALTGAGLARGLRPAIGRSWPATAAIGGVITVRLEVGFAPDTLPANLELAVLEYVRALSDGATPNAASHLVNDRLW